MTMGSAAWVRPAMENAAAQNSALVSFNIDITFLLL
jgi:hypothetical protein